MDNNANEKHSAGNAQPETKSNYEILIEDAFVEMARALKAVNFYPRGHPTLHSCMDRSYKSLIATFGDQEQLALGVSKDGFQLASNPFAPGNQILTGLAREFFLRQIKKVFFLKGVSPQELENFLRVMAMEEELFRGKGKAEEYLGDSNVEHIWANEIKLGQSIGMPVKEESAPEIAPIDDRLVKLIESLRKETDSRVFLGLVREASITASRFMDEGKPDQALVIMRVFWEAFSVEPLRSPMIVEAAKSAYKEISSPAMVDYILRQITLLDGPRKDSVLKVALGMDERLVRAIVDKLATNEALYSHRALIQVLLSIPDLSMGAVEAGLADERWWVARKMAFLLGEMGSQGSVPALIKSASHPDLRVQKEVLKALAKIKIPEGVKMLVELADSKAPQEIRIHSISLLGTIREKSAVPTLVKILKKKGAMLNEIEFLEEAVRALGKIGSAQAMPVLSDLLLKRSVFARAKSINLGVEAAEALGAIGGKEAEEILRRGAESRRQEIRLASLRALKAKRQTQVQGSEESNQGE